MNSKPQELEEAWGAFFVAHALAIRSIESAMRGKAPLTLDEYDLLLTIARHPHGRPRFSELAQATVFTRSGITRIAARLERRGLLAREQCAEDKRGAYALLTASGRDAMKESWKWYSRGIQALLDPCFTREQACTFRELNERIIDHSRAAPLIRITPKGKNVRKRRQ